MDRPPKKTATAKPASPAASLKSAPVKPKSAAQQALDKLGLRTPMDFALHVPMRYEDETTVVRLADAPVGESVQIEGVVLRCDITFKPRRQLVVQLQDDGVGLNSGGGERSMCTLRFFSFYPSHQKALAVGQRVRVRGELRGGFFGFEMVHPTIKPADAALAVALTPVYHSTAGLPQAYVRKAVASGLQRADLSETLPPQGLQALQALGLPPQWTLRASLELLHQPPPEVSLQALEDKDHPAWLRLKAEELLAQQLSQMQARAERASMQAPDFAVHEQASWSAALLKVLPFSLTSAQSRVATEIGRDMAAHAPMHRLLQGDVGSGKTVVAALAACAAMQAGWQCALMAPTEILAQQHFAKMLQWLQPLLEQHGKTVAWLTGSQKKKERTAMLASVESGQAALVVGTHALIQDSVVFHKLGLVIIDEQHRFGVAQRLSLRRKLTHTQGGRQLSPHLLMMTATPIPRTLAMSYYADLDVSTIDELPPGRTPIVTRVLPGAKREELVARIREQVEQGRQVYWVCPLIEESEALDLRHATQAHQELCEALGVEQPGDDETALPLVGLMHGKLPPARKQAVMQGFIDGHTRVLVSTTVIEVGVDVPNASLMVIEHAERFGLSQLHQLRGRVGRGAAASACVLLYEPPLGQVARARLRAMQQTNDGFELSRIDLELRGPGEFLGARQSGAALLRFAELGVDDDVLAWAAEQAADLLANNPQAAQRHMMRWMGGKVDYLKA
ncbi:MAG: ATP-dependent DNA helicase RecG [Burkholderiaceae bacterium]|jgi:ATP-dependent DNA helicase RecG|nr:ATP-dependent DNA helicase RecG [Burkholderiaceae bacterium]